MKQLLLIIFLILTQSYLLGQFEYDTVLLKKIVSDNLEEGYEDPFDKENKKMMSLAISKILKGKIFIPRHSYEPFTRTNIEILAREYDFVNESIVTGCVVPPFINYFEEIMMEASKMKYGANFLDSIKAVSDSLDKVGLGYVKSSFVSDSINLYDYFISKGVDKNVFTGKDNILRLISITVNEDGELSEIEYYQGRGSVMIVLEEMDTISKVKFSRAMNEMPNWKPAFLRGKPIKETSYIQMNGLMFDTN